MFSVHCEGKHTDLSLDSNLYKTFVAFMLVTTDNR